MSATTHTGQYDHNSHPHGNKYTFVSRWLFSTNHKDIGTLHLIFAVCAGVIGAALSEIMRAQLKFHGNSLVSTRQEWNTIATSHGLTMIFFTIMPALIGGFWSLVSRRVLSGLAPA